VSAGCSKCGDCCRAIAVPATKKRVREGNFGEDGWFILRHWHPISRAEAERRLPRIGRMRRDPGVRFYACDQFDAERNLCMAHDGRPDVCRGFPFYGGDPLHWALDDEGRVDLLVYPRCRYWEDVRHRLREALWAELVLLVARRSVKAS
jgi:Fe-S-cluster containining protein